ncbi:hypothetical protein KUD11_01255 [Roseovarius sp. LXJ103]|uniref:DUF6473 family protein n=1 Tax=Roseovarius carneus TaxID=2853164 RepID=UPI000D606992|nr:DUF6473 family protein [Roseovarius carneus]MBZ8117266.1 hypothetical protein [Roseovarius carneus]PWE36907.1 hypothetical protein DD563_13675 [Pelagicola sp. LXJ1103]
MAYEKLGQSPLDYMPCRYGASKLLFRGPRREFDAPYVACLGGTETYGKFIEAPFPALLEARTGVTCVNFGLPNAGIDVFLNDPGVLSIANNARLVVLQVPPALNMSNRFYTVHPRRNDRFVKASASLKSVFREVDFTEFHFTRHMLRHLRGVAPDRFDLIRDELQAAWIARMRVLLHQVTAPVALLWMSAHAPQESAASPDLVHDPAFVTCAMLDAVRPQVACVIDATVSAEALALGSRGMVFSELEGSAACELLGPAAHAEAAAALLPIVVEHVRI